ncbi:hypothetical protein D3C72_1702140 [compost metagenome]
MNAARDAPFQLAHQRQQAGIIQRFTTVFVHRHQRGDDGTGARAKARANRHTFFEGHGNRHVFADLLTEALPALINNIFARFWRQLTGKAANIIEAETVRRFDGDGITQQRTVERRNRRTQHIKSDAHIGAGSRGINFHHVKLLTSMTGYAADRQTRQPLSHHSLRRNRVTPTAMADNNGCKTPERFRRFSL